MRREPVVRRESPGDIPVGSGGRPTAATNTLIAAEFRYALGHILVLPPRDHLYYCTPGRPPPARGTSTVHQEEGQERLGARGAALDSLVSEKPALAIGGVGKRREPRSLGERAAPHAAVPIELAPHAVRVRSHSRGPEPKSDEHGHFPAIAELTMRTKPDSAVPDCKAWYE